MVKKINILLTPDEIEKLDEKNNEYVIQEVVGKEAQRKMWKRLIELGMISPHHDCTNWERTGHSPDLSPFCRWCRIKKELGIKDDQTNNSR